MDDSSQRQGFTPETLMEHPDFDPACERLNGHTQHPPSTALLMRDAPTWRHADLAWTRWEADRDRFRVDTDRRHHKRMLSVAVIGWMELTRSDPVGFWTAAAEQGWGALWAAATSIPTFGRLSAWSFLEYVSLAGIPVEPDGLMLRDLDGSRSHRNGLARVLGRDDLDAHPKNPMHTGYTPATLDWLEDEARRLLKDARARTDHRDVGWLTLESALCTFKSWSRPNRRYPGVYFDLMRDRISETEARFGVELHELWEARQALPSWMRVEDRPADPGAAPVKQNWYLRTGEVIGMRDTAAFANDFDAAVDRGETPRERGTVFWIVGGEATR